MTTTRTNSILTLVFVATLGLNAVVRLDPAQRNVEVMPDMVESVAAEAFSPHPYFTDGMTMRTPVAGTVPRGFRPLHYDASEGDAIRAGRELVNPFDENDGEAVVRGAAVYNAFCATCHGDQGGGDGPVTRRGVPPPPSLLAARALDMPDGQMFHVMTYGQNNMAPYAAQISRADRWKAVLHIRYLQLSARAQRTEPEP